MDVIQLHTGQGRRTVLVVDDHGGFRAVIRTVLEADGLEVVGEAVDGRAAVAATARLRPGLVLLDVHLPDLDGFAVCRLLARRSSPPAVVLTSSRAVPDLRTRLADAPVAGFLSKDDLSGSALRALVGW